ncbi:RES family NAD+ phosphorylase [Bradyrhizobium genomosp. I (2014)]|uniref:RES family NAD+ phosphorylase n=1 Tax=Bradyrhizobium genomosp. I (2014) TaxID=2683269 RepID=UPI000687F76F|nr:RES family NAD+ phosphorylase [Bradyrhizobium sp. CCBAU 43298]
MELYAGVASPEDWDAIKRIEASTNPRLRKGVLLPEDEGRVEQHWLVAPFAYPDPEPSAYGDGSFGFSIVAETLHSALLLAIARREIFLRRTAEGPCRLVMRVIKVPLKAAFTDLTDLKTDDPTLRTRIAELRANKSYGVLVRGPRGAGNPLAVVLRPTAFVPPAAQTEHFCFLWNGERIHKLFSLPAETKVIVPEDLLKSESDTAA